VNVWLFRISDGRWSSRLAGRLPVLLLTTRGRKSHQPRTIALIYVEHGDSQVIVGSQGGLPAHPHWYLNLVACPDATVRTASETFAVRARTAHGEERDELWALARRLWPGYDTYQARTAREIPVVILERNTLVKVSGQ
jgi:deazaflavin-dependent oxidoreductase (nitroreductase family)